MSRDCSSKYSGVPVKVPQNYFNGTLATVTWLLCHKIMKKIDFRRLNFDPLETIFMPVCYIVNRRGTTYSLICLSLAKEMAWLHHHDRTPHIDQILISISLFSTERNLFNGPFLLFHEILPSSQPPLIMPKFMPLTY